MKTFEVQAIEIEAPYDRAYSFIADPRNLSKWAKAFREVSDGSALMETPNGSVKVELVVHASREQGTIDWVIAFPDGALATAYSRVVRAGRDRSIYSFVLMAPPLPLEELEGALEQQSETLREELERLRLILEEQPHGNAL
ncbi:MAG: SRPBCC family protein [Acidobacteria bacterium]|nr:SRPBCC family protein [Acidobacteriota bacterium]